MTIKIAVTLFILMTSNAAFSSTSLNGYVDPDELKVAELRKTAESRLLKDCVNKKLIANGNKTACRQYASETSLQRHPLVRGSITFMSVRYTNLTKQQALDELVKIVNLANTIKSEKSLATSWDGRITLPQLDREANYIQRRYFPAEGGSFGVSGAKSLLAQKGRKF